MGYDMSGTVTIEPPLNFKEIRKAQNVALNLLTPKSLAARHATPDSVFADYMPLKLRIDEFDRETDDGVLRVRQAEVLVPSFDSNASLRYDMTTLVNGLRNALPGHLWEGTIVAVHEERAYAEKLVVDAEGSRTVKGTVFLRWEGESGEIPLDSIL
jgi:hypothetical protein